MSTVDSLLTALKTWREQRKDERARIVGYLRKIASATGEFRDCLAQINSGAPQRVWGTIRVDTPEGRLEKSSGVWVLRDRAELIGEYYRGISGALGSAVKSELLDELAEYLSRIYIADSRSITMLTELDRRTTADLISVEPDDGSARIDAPDFDAVLLELSTLSARIRALADHIEVGADYR